MSVVATTSTPEFPWESPIPSGPFWHTIPNNLARQIQQTIPSSSLQEWPVNGSAFLSKVERLRVLDEILSSKVADAKTEYENGGSIPTCTEGKHYTSLLFLHSSIKSHLNSHSAAESILRLLLSIHPQTGHHGALSHSLKAQGKLSSAEFYAKKSLQEVQEHALLGRDSPQALGAMRLLMEIWALQGRFGDAWGLYREAEGVVEGMVGGRFGKYGGEEREGLEEVRVLIGGLERGVGGKL